MHISRYHDDTATPSDCNQFPFNAIPESLFHEDNINSEDKCFGTENILPLSKDLILFYLKVREFYVLPVKIAKNIMDDVVKLLSLFKEEMEAAVQSTID